MVRALDLFAGTGWGVACQWLGIKEFGVEIMPEAIATRTANGMETIFEDVWDGLERPELVPFHNLLIASPPCQTFSLAGKGSGRKALDEVLEAIELHAYKDHELLREFGEKHDERTALVLAPLAYVHTHRPRWVALEQVPTVLPVWEACADVLRGMGYSVETAILNAEQYGVPQTRRRAILVAHRDGDVSLPTPTHSRYYSRTPEKLDPGVLPWISMAEALDWRGLSSRPAPTITGGGTETGGAEPIAKYHERYTHLPEWRGSTARLSIDETAALQSYPSELRPEVRNWKWVNAPATTIAGDPRITAREHHNHGEQSKTSLRLTEGEMHTLQTYPADPPFTWCGTKTKQFLQIGNAVPPVLARAILSALIEEAA